MKKLPQTDFTLFEKKYYLKIVDPTVGETFVSFNLWDEFPIFSNPNGENINVNVKHIAGILICHLVSEQSLCFVKYTLDQSPALTQNSTHETYDIPYVWGAHLLMIN